MLATEFSLLGLDAQLAHEIAPQLGIRRDDPGEFRRRIDSGSRPGATGVREIRAALRAMSSRDSASTISPGVRAAQASRYSHDRRARQRLGDGWHRGKLRRAFAAVTASGFTLPDSR